MLPTESPSADEPAQMPKGADRMALNPDEADEEQTDRRSLWRLLPVLAAIIIAIIVLLLLRDCGGARGGASGSRTRSIERVQGMEPVAGVISLWVKGDADVTRVLATAGVRAGEKLDLGGGRYVVDVPQGSENAAVAALKKTAGVYDAGRVFEKE